jgi:NADPH-dependent glutamate synthase beta subunit-like oxidoreductase
VAVIGSGPAGLSATYHLALLGYPVTLFEAGRELGGLLRTGIPAYRLPRKILDKEIGHILHHDVTVHLGMRIEREDLLRISHESAAVFVATGLQETRSLNLGQFPEDVVLEGIDFLDNARHQEVWLGGQDIVVIGGGNTAIDAARSALRLGAHQVRIIYRRTRAEMPAITEEIEEALEEGILLDELVSPLRLDVNGDSALLTCTRMRLGAPDESGRPRPEPDLSEGAQFDLRCDRVILALGQTADLSILPEGSEVHENEQLLGLTGGPIFTGGDLAANEGTVTAAIGSGRRAAWHMHRTLTGEDLFPAESARVAGPDEIATYLFSPASAEQSPMVHPKRRRRSFTEVRMGFVEEPGHHQARVEAERCFSCGVCNSCDRCVTHCPEGIVFRDGDGYSFQYDHCKGCGVCASQCPRSVIFMAELA